MTTAKYDKSLLKHEPEDCPLVKHRIACVACSYPFSEALFDNPDDYDDLHDLLFDAPGG